jgi:hypothetical protein
MHPQTYILYAVLSAALQVGSGQDLILERSMSTSPHLCLFGDDAAALLSDLPLSNGSGLNAEADEAMWGAYHPGFSGGILTLYEPSLLLFCGLWIYHVLTGVPSPSLSSLCQGKIDRL